MNVGHTGITWGIPGDVEQAYRDTADWLPGLRDLRPDDPPGMSSRGYRALVERYGIPTGAAYCHKTWT